MSVKPVRRLGIVAALMIGSVVGLFAAPAFAQTAEIDIGADECTVVVRFEEATEGDTAGVRVGGIPPTADAGLVAVETATVGSDGTATIVVPLQFTTPPAQNGQWHVTIQAGIEGQGILVERNRFVSDCPDPVAPTTPPTGVVTTTTAIVPVGGVDTGTGPGPSVLIPLAGLGLLVVSTLWMRRRSAQGS